MLDLALLYPSPLAITVMGILFLLTGAGTTRRENMVLPRARARRKRF